MKLCGDGDGGGGVVRASPAGEVAPNVAATLLPREVLTLLPSRHTHSSSIFNSPFGILFVRSQLST